MRPTLITRARTFFLVSLLLMTLVPGVWSGMPEIHRPDNQSPLYLTNATLIDVQRGTAIHGRALWLKDGKIAGIYGSDNAAPDGARHIDLKGSFVSPGLVDMHVHLHDIKELSTHLAYGVTTVRNLRGFPAHLRWRERVARGDWLGATLITASPSIAGPDSHALNTSVTNPEEARTKVRQYQQRGFDLIKVYGGLSGEVLSAVLDEARRVGIPVAKHAPHAEGLALEAISTAQSLEHVEDIFQGPLDYTFDEEQLRVEAARLAELGVPVVPTLATFDHLTQLSQRKSTFVRENPIEQLNPFFRYLYRKASVERWLEADADQITWNVKERDFLLRITRALDKAGVPLLVGSDAGTMFMTAGLSTHREMQLMQLAGVSPATILRAATINAAQTLELKDVQGTVAEGKWADLVVTTHNPLEDVSYLESPAAVVRQGQWLGRDELDAIIKSARTPSGWFAGVAMLLEHWWKA